MARMAIEEGITHAVLTPHFHQGIYDNQVSTLKPVFETFKEQLAESQIPLEIAVAGEVRISTDLLHLLPAGNVPFIGSIDDTPVMLLELPYSHIPPGTDNLLNWLHKNNVKTMIAHPERNREIISNPSAIKQLKLGGTMFQLTVGSFSEMFGEKVRDTAETLLLDGYADIVATDAHRIDKRPPTVKAGLDAISALVGPDIMKRLSFDTPKAISQVLF
ncbi:hypothetical protein GCM10025776_23470 [Corallincola platygyrae]